MGRRVKISLSIDRRIAADKIDEREISRDMKSARVKIRELDAWIWRKVEIKE